MRQCALCKESKSESEFYFSNKAANILSKRCKACDKQTSRQSRKRHLSQRRKKARELYLELRKKGWKRTLTPEQKQQFRLYSRAYCRKHRDIYLARATVRDAVKRYDKWLAGELNLNNNSGPLLFRAHDCYACRKALKNGEVRHHHIRSYSKQDHLFTLPLCPHCHHELHNLQRDLEISISEATRRFLLQNGKQTENRLDDQSSPKKED